MNKYKITIKGNEDGYKVDTKGDINYIITSIMQFACEVTIENEITKKEFLERCKNTYEEVMKLMNESEDD